MIVAPVGGQLLVVTQNDHAHLAGELLSLWRRDGLPEHPRRHELLFAAREHDNGWREADAAPRSRDGGKPHGGKPHDFISISRELRWEIWHRGTSRYVDREPYAAALILRHAIHLHRSHRDDPDWADVFERWFELDAELIERHDFDVDALDRDYRWIDLTDSLSLAVCDRRPGPIREYGFEARASFADDGDNPLAGNTLTVTPFPLAGATTLGISCRLIPDRPYRGDTDLATELAMARWQKGAVRVVPAEGV